MSEALWIFALLMLLIGAAFIALGSVGLLRMPDIYNRLQAGTKSATLGFLAVLIGVAIAMPAWWPKLLVLGVFMLITNPLGSSTLARSALLTGHKPYEKSAGKPRPDQDQSTPHAGESL